MRVECNNSTKTWGRQSSLLSVNILVAIQTRSSYQEDKICVALLNLQLGQSGVRWLSSSFSWCKQLHLSHHRMDLRLTECYVLWLDHGISESSLLVCLRWPHPPTGFSCEKHLSQGNCRALNIQNKQKAKIIN